MLLVGYLKRKIKEEVSSEIGHQLRMDIGIK